MALKHPGNGLYVVNGETSMLITLMKKYHWSSKSYQENENNPFLKNLVELKAKLNQIYNLREIELNAYIDPFLDVIYSDETSVQVTVLALSSVNKFISYDLMVEVDDNYLLPTIDRIANVVAHANCIATDLSSDNVIYMKIVEVLRSLVLSSLGYKLTNDRICDIMLTCFRICFETRLNELLRHNAEYCLKNIIQFLFTRLPSFIKTPAHYDTHQYKKMRMRPKSVNNNSNNNHNQQSTKKYVLDKPQEILSPDNCENKPTAITCENSQSEDNNFDFEEQDATYGNNVTNDAQPFVNSKRNLDENIVSLEADSSIPQESEETSSNLSINEKNIANEVTWSTPSSPTDIESSSFTEEINQKQYINSQGVRFMSDEQNLKDWLIAERIPLEPHNIICVQELLRFLAVICNPHDKQNTDIMRHISLSLVTVALEVGANAICEHPLLLTIIKDTLCRNLMFLLKYERMPKQICMATLHVLLLLFESMRDHLKFQMEYFLLYLSEIVHPKTTKVSNDLKELAFGTLIQLWRIPGLITELFLNYDCKLYCPNLFENITKLLAENASQVDGLYHVQLLSLDALLTIIESVEKHCHSPVLKDKSTLELESDCIINAINEEPMQGKSSFESENSLRYSFSNDGHEFDELPSHKELMTTKRIKKVLTSATEKFNVDPKKGIQYLQEQNYLRTPLEPEQIVEFLRENPRLDKKQIGEYISNRSNLPILKQFVKSFNFENMRLDQALRLYLESFRLPGESPLISIVLQHFTDQWHECNNEPFSKSESAFLLAYAIIMLNTDLHNQAVRRQKLPMTLEGFKKNLKGLDDGNDFDQELLDTIYQSIKNDEIVMPAEQVGLVRENYMWDILLRRGSNNIGRYISGGDGMYDHELFALSWKPVVNALDYIFDKAVESSVCYKCTQGFRKCATVSAHYEINNAFDRIIERLCRFTMLTDSSESLEVFTLSFGTNAKGRLATRTVFDLVHQHGDILHEGWRLIFDCIFKLFRCRLLPKMLIEAEDFLELSGKVSLIREDVTSNKTMEVGLFSSLYSYITLAADVASQKVITEEEEVYIEIAKTCIADCHIENLIQESKFLRPESLGILLEVLIHACYNSESNIVLSTKQDEDKVIFFLELLLKVIIQNRDRISSVWQMVCDHLYAVLMAAAATDQQFLIERCVIGLLRLAIRLMKRDEIRSSVLQLLRIILLLKWNTVYSVSRQISYGLYELLKSGAADIHSEVDWSVIFMLLEVVGAGSPLQKLANSSENTFSELSNDSTNTDCATEDSGLGGETQYFSSSDSLNQLSSVDVMPYKSYLFQNDCDERNIMRSFYTCHKLLPHDPFSLVKCCESLAFLIRDVTHITPCNFKSCVHTLRIFVEATLYSGKRKQNNKKISTFSKTRAKNKNSTTSKKTKFTFTGLKTQSNIYEQDESDTEEYPDSYFQVPLQLLDLMHTLHTKTAHIHNGWTEINNEQQVSSLWSYGWCPLLQGIACLCSDSRKSVRMSAITYLQRALLMQDLQKLKGHEWESCFNNVLFPLLEKLAEPFQGKDFVGVEETRMRVATLLSKVFLHHLSPLQLLPTFTNLWLKILHFMSRYMNIDESSDLLNEAIQECVKNMILVMESAQLFSEESELIEFWELTWKTVDKFVPNLKDELSRYHSNISVHNGGDQHNQALNSPESPKNEFRDSKIDESVVNEEYIDPKQVDNSLVKHSVPIFPHMGRLISTPIGPPPISKNYEDSCSSNSGESVENIHSHTQMSSLIVSNSEFISSLPSFTAQPSIALCRPANRTKDPSSSFDLPTEHSSELSLANSVSPECVPHVVTQPGSFQNVNQTSMSMCETSEANTLTSNVLSEVSQTESFPVMTQTRTSPDETPSSNILCARLIEHPKLAYDAKALSPSEQPSANNSSFTNEKQGVPCESTNILAAIPNYNNNMASFPVYSGFTQLGTDKINNIEENNAKQFFYQNW